MLTKDFLTNRPKHVSTLSLPLPLLSVQVSLKAVCSALWLFWHLQFQSSVRVCRWHWSQTTRGLQNGRSRTDSMVQKQSDPEHIIRKWTSSLGKNEQPIWDWALMERVTSFKFIEIHITEDLPVTWSLTGTHLKQKAQPRLVSEDLRCCKMPQNKLYRHTLESTLTYCRTVWYSSLKSRFSDLLVPD